MALCSLTPIEETQITEGKCELVIEWERKHHAEYMRKWRETHPEYREKQKVSFSRFCKEHPEYIYNYNKDWRKQHPEKVSRTLRQYRQRNPNKISAQRKAQRLVVDSCVKCGSKEQIERHHPDYSQPLLITPLCHSCHVNEHLLKTRKREAGKA